jgi:hypothetical protein
MYNHSVITSCFAGLIGFEQSYNQDHDLLDSDLVQARSGLLLSHPLLSYDNLLSVSEQFSRVNVRVWQAGTYWKDNIVKKDDDIFQSLEDGNTALTTDTAKWRKTNLISAYLRKVYNNSVIRLFASIMTQKKIGEVAKSLLGNINLFEGAGNITGRITKSSRFVGFKIRLRSRDTIAIIHAIGLQVDTAQNPITLYLYHTSSNIPVKTFTINQTKSIQWEWHKVVDETLAYMSETINAGGSYYLGYYEADLTGSAIKKDLNWNGVAACGTCSEGLINNMRYKQRSPYVSIQPFYVNAPLVAGQLWDETSEIFVYDSNFGLNLQLSVQCDVSAWLCQNTNIFTDALYQQLTVDILSQMAFSLRDNQAKEKIAALAATALDNQEGGQHGEAKKLQTAIDGVSFDVARVNSICLPCSTENKVGISSVWA